MRLATRLATVGVPFALLASIANGSTRTCVTSITEGFSISPEYASVGSNPLYKGNQSTVDNPLYSGSAFGGVRITLTGSNFKCVGLPSVSANGEIFAEVIDQTTRAPSIVALGQNGPTRTISTAATGDASGAPVSSANGTVVFKSISQGHPVLLTAAPGSAFTGTIPSPPFDSLRSVACSTKGDLIIDATAAAPSVAAAYIGSVGGGITGTLPDTSNLQLPGVSDATYGLVVKNSTTQLGEFVVAPRDVKTGQSSGRRSYTAGRFALDCTIACDQSSALVAMCDSQSIRVVDAREVNTGLPAGLMAGVILPPPNLISVGDSLGGGTITGLSLSPQAFTTTGELMFWASIVDSGGASSNGIFAITVPEPTTLGAIASAGLLAVRRRARSLA